MAMSAFVAGMHKCLGDNVSPPPPAKERMQKLIFGWMAEGTAASPTAEWPGQSVACLGVSWGGLGKIKDNHCVRERKIYDKLNV